MSTSAMRNVAWPSRLRIDATSARRSNWKVTLPLPPLTIGPIVNVDDSATAVDSNSSGARPSAVPL